MEVPPPEPIVPVREVMPALGFEPVWNSMAEKAPAFRYVAGGIDIEVAEVTSEWLRPEFLIGGHASNGRTLRYVEQSMPLFVESREQVVAWLAFAVGTDFVPTKPVPWFEEGKLLQALLPWERARAQLLERARVQEAARKARPYCEVAWEWMRPLRRHLRACAASASTNDLFRLHFDGRMLVVRLDGSSVGVPAVGPRAWSEEVEGLLRHFALLPKRFQQRPVTVGVWEGRLEVDRWSAPLGAAAGPRESPMTPDATQIPLKDAGAASARERTVLVTEEAAAEARARLRRKLGQL